MTRSFESLLDTCPRTRPPLPSTHQRVYEKEYQLNREGEAVVEALAKRLEAWMHKKVAHGSSTPVLEVGAGTLNHLRFESSLQDYDITEPFRALYEGSPRLDSIRNIYATLAEIPPDQRYARIISVAVLEHLEDLPSEIARCCLLLKQDGIFQAGIPSEGGFLWWLGWRSTTGITYWMRNRLDYGILMRHEHLSTAPEIITILRSLFGHVSVRRLPLPLHHLSLYAYIEARQPRKELAARILGR